MSEKRVCGLCGNIYRVKANGAIRRHWCVGRRRVETRRVELLDGGALTLVLRDANPLEWPASHRAAFFALVDALTAFEATQIAVSGGTPKGESK